MRNWFISQLQKILKVLAHATLRKYQPGIVAVTGSVGKTSTREAIYTVLRGFRRVRASYGNFNSEIGVSLTIIGEWPEQELVSRAYAPGSYLFHKALFFLKVIFTGVWQLLWWQSDYPEVLILEYGADKPGDIDALIAIARPQIAVVTAIGDLPVHVEQYSGPEAVAREKVKIIIALPVAGFAVLNYDDPTVRAMAAETTRPVFSFGFSEGASVQIIDFSNRSDAGKPAGIAFTLTHGDTAAPVRIDGVFGRAQALAAAAAAAVGLSFSLNLARIAESLAFYQSPPHRMKLLMGIKDTYLIDDCYNASPLSMQAALATIKDLPAKRKVGVLGDMLELGAYSVAAHELIGTLACRVFDFLITIGPRAKIISDIAQQRGLNEKNIRHYDDVARAQIEIVSLLKSGDLVLIKASHAVDLEKLVEEIVYK